MRTPSNIDDRLLAEARRMTGPVEKSVLVREGLKVLAERESARRLALLAGGEPLLQPPAKRNRRDPGKRRS
ncbi:type II toxin-antitoxin system VapB family antitoxin [Methylococcus geothermalis]|uniref:Type II toxin-antitoxin system VapB family antitoxin n=1 Tax=Methylococcus geothermalis TaxID=2681310 RepID=A0A858Q4Y2_9GAMM|nr:type II toxin-antitoxin system VapB family antitoxin [Methylococcus geothermalis]QJD28796.1 type II toxin-antitoxin system VapB family antitoxin [Methylococcus geothermalis]